MDEAQSISAISMAKLLGEIGKTSMKFCSETGIEEFKQKFFMTNSEAAAFLRELAQQIETDGKAEVSYGSLSISVNPTQPIKLEVEYEKNELEIEVKFKEKT
ncbi:MAG TPA: amphi-Trp domain-containing protein [Methanothrix sp.]|nr:amphi-Trp domain-containing protein [Methanothrix sp.]